MYVEVETMEGNLGVFQNRILLDCKSVGRALLVLSSQSPKD